LVRSGVGDRDRPVTVGYFMQSKPKNFGWMKEIAC
jgi:hypothetical protein